MEIVGKVKKAVESLNTKTELSLDRDYYSRGDFDEPYAPPGLEYYQELRDISGAPLIKTAVRIIARRLKLQGLHLDPTQPADNELMRILRKNRWASIQGLVWRTALTQEVGIVSVWPNEEDPAIPHINVETPDNIFLGWSVENSMKLDYVVKYMMIRQAENGIPSMEKAYYYTDEWIVVFSRQGNQGVWQQESVMPNSLGRIPFVLFIADRDDKGKPLNFIDPLIPLVKSIDALRYFLLLAAQFAAYRQRIGTGIDPIIRDSEGNPIFKIKRENGIPVLDEDGEEILELDENDMPIPLMQKPGRVGVDRMLIFPGESTKVYDLQESDLKNYISALQYFEGSFCATSNVPSQYMNLGDWSNVAGDTMEANEGALRTFISDLQETFNDGIRDLVDLINLARDREEQEIEVSWRNLEPKGLAQVSLAASQMVPHGAPMRMFLEMLATSPYDVQRWESYSQDQAMQALTGNVAPQYGLKLVDDGSGN